MGSTKLVSPEAFHNLINHRVRELMGLAALVRSVVQALFAWNRLILYERGVTLDGLQPRADDTRTSS